jgi:type IV pilus assembly protein PilB
MVDILALLVGKGVIDDGDAAAVAKQAQETGESIDAILLKRGISNHDLLAARAEHWELPSRVIGKDLAVPFEVLQYIPEESAQHYRAVPLGIEDGALAVGVVDPDNIEALDALNFISSRNNIPFKVYLISEEGFAQVLKMYKGISGEVGLALTELESELQSDENNPVDLNSEHAKPPVDPNADAKATDGHITEEAPVTKIVATLLRNAVEGRASDIHIEHTGEKVRVRFRVDGVLHTSITLPPKVHRAVVARVKVLSSMKLDERRKPQDGRFSATIGGRKIDFRVSTFPAQFGEKVVMRILDRDTGLSSLEILGMRPEHLEMVRAAVRKPYGMILISGPTGSGKSTSLYSMLKEVDRDENNVLSLEDPVEYNIEGVSQSQVRPEIGYTFASGLRSVLRQDPDIIMVGEIRDKETAQLAIQAALTGHLVFSTIHTNNAAGVVPRLIDMGVDPYLIAPTLELVIAQRLVRRLCDGAGKPIPVEGGLKAMFDAQFADLPEQYRAQLPPFSQVYGISPTGDCPSGTRGRLGVYEMFTMDTELEQAILKSSDETAIYSITRARGMLTMKEDAIIKAINRQIPFEEVNTLGGEFLTDDEATPVIPEQNFDPTQAV